MCGVLCVVCGKNPPVGVRTLRCFVRVKQRLDVVVRCGLEMNVSVCTMCVYIFRTAKLLCVAALWDDQERSGKELTYL